MVTVHHLNNSRSQRVLWLLEELGCEYRIARYQRDPRTLLAPPELKRVHPLGKSPVVTDGPHVLAESGAIIEYLTERYANGRLRPPPGSAERCPLKSLPAISADELISATLSLQQTERQPMTFPPRGRSRILLIVAATAAVWMSALSAQAQQPGASSPTASAPPASPAPAATAKKPPAKSGATEADSKKSASSYSLGLMWGEQLRNTGLAPDAVSTARIAQGIHDAMSGKATTSQQDRENIQALATSGVDANHHAAEKFLAENAKKPGVTTTASGLEYQELRAGSGTSPRMGDSVNVNYRGTLLNGTEFDSSYKRGVPVDFEVGRVIPGWNEALQLMKPGAKWKLFIPPKLAYDLRSPPGSGIPPGSMLIFEVELLGVKAATGAAPSSGNPPPGALNKATGKPPVNTPDNPNSPSPATVAPAPK